MKADGSWRVVERISVPECTGGLEIASGWFILLNPFLVSL